MAKNIDCLIVPVGNTVMGTNVPFTEPSNPLCNKKGDRDLDGPDWPLKASLVHGGTGDENGEDTGKFERRETVPRATC